LLGIIRLYAAHVRRFLRHQYFHQFRQAGLELGCCLVAASQRSKGTRKRDGQWEISKNTSDSVQVQPGSDNVGEASGQQWKQTTKQQPTHSQPMELCGVGTWNWGGLVVTECHSQSQSVGGSTVSGNSSQCRWQAEIHNLMDW